MNCDNSIFFYDAKRRKTYLTNNMTVLKTFIEAIIVLVKEFPQNYFVVENKDIDKYETISQNFFKTINKYHCKTRKPVPDDIKAKGQNLYDWLIKSFKEAVYMPAPGRYKVNEYGFIIKTMLSDLEGYATNAETDYCFKSS